MKKLCLVMLVLIASAGTSQATVTINRIDDINSQETTAVASYQTDGADMVGMLVTANGSGTQEWEYLTATGDYGVQTSGWSLIENDDTFNGNWTLTTTGTSLKSLFIDAGPGDTMFDTRSDAEYTSGSSIGREFNLTYPDNYSGQIDVTYSGPVSLSGQSFAGDLYRYMLIDFAVDFSGTLKFRTDTDNAAFKNDITPTVPAPGALVLASLGTGLAGFIRRRRCV